MLYLSKS